MILIADSGSTKTDWRLIGKDSFEIFKCDGLNPKILSVKKMESILLSLKIPFDQVNQLFFFGAGCSTKVSQEKIHKLLRSIFVNANVKVQSDLMGAAISLFGKDSGMAGILGTGSNLAFFDGSQLHQKTKSLGYLLGDQGGGCYMGKLFLQEYLNGDLDSKILNNFKFSSEEIIENLYSSSNPNRYMASFCPFLFRNRSHPQISKLICRNFEDWFELHHQKYELSNLSVVGSIAYYFKPELIHVASRYDCKIDKVLENPIASLALHYKIE